MTLYGQWISNWERRLTLRDPNRRIYPFSWGVDWITVNGDLRESPLVLLKRWSSRALQDSQRFFSADRVPECALTQNCLVFDTPTPSPIAENNRVSCRVFPAKNSDRAVIVIPQWNALSDSHVGLCRMLQRLGITTVRMTLPYHEERRPPGMKRAEFMVGPNVGRTLHAVRQAVIEARLVVNWLKKQNFQKIGIVGTSLGSCVAYLVLTHDTRIDTGVFNHVSAHFADVVWTGLATRYVLWGLEGFIRRQDLKECWAPLSPWYYVERLKEHYRPHLLITAQFDLTFLPEYSREIFMRYKELELPCHKIELPCGHYTTARFPFSWIDGWHICQHFRKHLC